MLPAGRRVAGKPRPARVPLPQGLRGPPGQPAGSPSLCSGFFASRPGSGRQIRRHLPRSGPKKGREKRGGGRGGGLRGGAPPLPAAQLEQDLRGQHRPGSAPTAAGEGRRNLFGGGFGGGGGRLLPPLGCWLRVQEGRGGGGGAVPGGGGGGDAAAAAAAVAAAAVAVAGATASSSGRDAERASESGGEEPGAHHSWIPHSNFKPRPRLSPANLVANRRAPPAPSCTLIGRSQWQCGRGRRGREPQLESGSHPKARYRPSPLPLPLKAGAN